MAEIVYPCPEKNWETLEGNSDDNRFCNLCLKKVYAEKRNERVYCGVDTSNGMSYHTFLARFAVILFFVFGSGLFTNVLAQDEPSEPAKEVAPSGSLGELKGEVTDKETGEPMAFAVVSLWQNETRITRARTDFDGKFKLSVVPGEYEINLESIGYNSPDREPVVIKADEIVFRKLSLGQDDMPFVGLIVEPDYILEDHRSTTFKRKEVQQHPKR